VSVISFVLVNAHAALAEHAFVMGYRGIVGVVLYYSLARGPHVDDMAMRLSYANVLHLCCLFGGCLLAPWQGCLEALEVIVNR